MHFLWMITPDGIALFVFAISLWRWQRCSDDDLPCEIVDTCVRECHIRKVDVHVVAELKEFARQRFYLDNLEEAAFVSGIISMSGAVEIAIVQEKSSAVVGAIPFWILIVVLQVLTKFSSERKKNVMLRKRLLIGVLMAYTVVSLVLKAVVSWA